MNGMSKKSIITILLLILALTAGSTIVVARSAVQEAAGSEDLETVEQLPSGDRLLSGSAPDEAGYAGAIPTQGSIVTEPSETGVGASVVTEPIDWTRYVQGPQPDEDNNATTAGPNASIPQWSAFRYINVAGATLVPRASATSWTYPGGGCISAADANDIFNIHLSIPNGSRIDYLRIYYYDTSTNNSTAWVTTYNGAGVTTDLISVNSTGAAGYGTALSAYVGHVVDTANNSYVLNWRANQTDSTMRLCGLRVAYRDPA